MTLRHGEIVSCAIALAKIVHTSEITFWLEHVMLPTIMVARLTNIAPFHQEQYADEWGVWYIKHSEGRFYRPSKRDWVDTLPYSAKPVPYNRAFTGVDIAKLIRDAVEAGMHPDDVFTIMGDEVNWIGRSYVLDEIFKVRREAIVSRPRKRKKRVVSV